MQTFHKPLNHKKEMKSGNKVTELNKIVIKQAFPCNESKQFMMKVTKQLQNQMVVYYAWGNSIEKAQKSCSTFSCHSHIVMGKYT